MHIKKDDTVIVLTGKDKGKKGRVGKIKKRTSADDGRFSKAFDMLLLSLVEC